MANAEICHGNVMVTVDVNGKSEHAEVRPLTALADFLRDNLGLTGTKMGCRSGDCGSCTVLVDEVPIASCLMPVTRADGRTVATVEGLSGEHVLSSLQEAFRQHNASQCGFCIPGILMVATSFLGQSKPPARQEVIDGLSGNLCRCTGYESIVNAISDVVGGEES